ncbi:ABC-type polysaccharide/polyol phosphate transport system ATPase subunit [Bacillus pakistanensis]|uniref:ABC-type polysaccharide/polyol phosphate transport system ATPase subunit n=1 Tax=Rossellomorea pakistanensis TaxID=992288 RepID=A0ABS2ND38_9BACI|nr:ABC-type polysaccharide/polyol phosphate transport system ATPase subunit [Bacillus pakistanensis]
MIKLKDLWVSYPRQTEGIINNLKRAIRKEEKKKEFWALRGLDFEVQKGEVLGVIGRNGSGKSTLLKILSGLITPDKGEFDVKGNLPVLLSLGAGFEPDLSGKENIYLNGLLLGQTKSEIDEKMNEIVDFSELGDFIYEPVRTYSSGMRSRLAFSIAITIDPNVLLIDEVLGVGDQSFRDKSKDAILEKIKQNRTVILVTHSASLVREICDRVVWIHLGEQKEIGTVDEVVPKYVQFMREIRGQKQ